MYVPTDDPILKWIRNDLELSVADLEEKLDTSITRGLDDHEADNRYGDAGPNVSTKDRDADGHLVGGFRATARDMIRHLIGMHNLPLWFGALLCFGAYLYEEMLLPWLRALSATAAVGQNRRVEDMLQASALRTDNLFISLGLLAFIVVFGLFSYYMDAKCTYYVDSCRDLVPRQVVVVREGVPQLMSAARLVVGDLVCFAAGDQLAADLKLTAAAGVTLHATSQLLPEVDRRYYSQLYGAAYAHAYLTPGQVMFANTCVASGHGRGIVLRTRNYYLSGVRLKDLIRAHPKWWQRERQREDSHKSSNSANSSENSSSSPSSTPGLLQTQIDHFLHKLSYVSLAISASYGASAYLLVGLPAIYSLLFFISHYVGIITEALVPTFSVAKAQSSKKLAFRNCYIQNIDALETLGTTSVVCTAKTGVLTQANQMVVSRVWFDHREMASFEFVRAVSEPERKTAPQQPTTSTTDPARSLVRAVCLASFAHFSVNNTVDGGNVSPLRRAAIGSSTEVALLRFAEASLATGSSKHYRSPPLVEAPYSAQRKCSFKVYKEPNVVDGSTGGRQLLVCVKGQPEQLLSRCAWILTTSTGGNHSPQPFTGQDRQRLLDYCDQMGRRRYRMIAVAEARGTEKSEDGSLFEDGQSTGQPTVHWSLDALDQRAVLQWRLLGLFALENPVRVTVPEAIFTCRRAGIKVILTTADHPQTALAIARTVGIVLRRPSYPNLLATKPSGTLANSYTSLALETLSQASSDSPGDSKLSLIEPKSSCPAVVSSVAGKSLFTGCQLSKLSDGQLRAILGNGAELVFARLTPTDKVRIVRALRDLGEIVTVTGVTGADLPVFDHAHVRLSAGTLAAEVAKRQADIILLDDNFASLVEGIEQGRVLFENIKKSLCYTLSSKPVELLPYLVFLTVGVPHMAGPIVVLAIDLITDNLPPISLGYELAESYVMDEPPAYFLRGKIVNFETIVLSLCFYGVVQFSSGLFAYAVVMADNGFRLADLVGIRHRGWKAGPCSDMVDSYGQEWTFKQRQQLENLCQTVYMTTVMVTRIGVLFCCRTRKDSCLRTLFSNSMANFSIFFLLFMALFFSYFPPFQYDTDGYTFKYYWWLLGLPFVALLLTLEELRKLVIRRYPRSELARLMYY